MNKKTADSFSSQEAVIQRVVPGRIIYVSTYEDGQQLTLPFKLNNVEILAREGESHPYRGESFSELDLHVGKKLQIKRKPNADPILIVDLNKRDNFISRVSYFLKPKE